MAESTSKRIGGAIWPFEEPSLAGACGRVCFVGGELFSIVRRRKHPARRVLRRFDAICLMSTRVPVSSAGVGGYLAIRHTPTNTRNAVVRLWPMGMCIWSQIL